ncbi:hypothetical protein B0A55_02830 [Friedmanniomyces simplex]|uniref:Uncharacterized protein n=1 Tax=Friedmanniomyces simplex TaxID=329884 RepID=A0A4U0XRX8_9PEZI|nr:hypothetical protein B0A55_02830 [Friedmanniomyces simplex]
MDAKRDGLVPRSVPAELLRGFLKSQYARDDGAGVLPGFEHIEGPTSPAGAAPTCPKTCKICIQHYRPTDWQQCDWLRYASVWDDDQAVKAILSASEKAKVCFDQVAGVLKRSGNSIARRWKKKSVSARAALLREATLELEDQPRAAQGLIYQPEQEDVATWKRNHESWLLPYLDIDGLSRNPSRLLLLLHYRTHHTLQDWFAHDCLHLKCAFSEGLVMIAYNPHCVVVHENRYGDLREWESVAAHRGDIVGFPRAMATFEAQERLAVVLKTVVDLLHGNEAPLGNDH